MICGSGVVQDYVYNLGPPPLTQSLPLSPQHQSRPGFQIFPFIFVVFPLFKPLVMRLANSTIEALKLKIHPQQLMPKFAWKWTLAKNSQQKLILLVRNIYGLKNLIMKMFYSDAKPVLKLKILAKSCPKATKKNGGRKP